MLLLLSNQFWRSPLPHPLALTLAHRLLLLLKTQIVYNLRSHQYNQNTLTSSPRKEARTEQMNPCCENSPKPVGRSSSVAAFFGQRWWEHSRTLRDCQYLLLCVCLRVPLVFSCISDAFAVGTAGLWIVFFCCVAGRWNFRFVFAASFLCRLLVVV